MVSLWDGLGMVAPKSQTILDFAAATDDASIEHNADHSHLTPTKSPRFITAQMPFLQRATQPTKL